MATGIKWSWVLSSLGGVDVGELRQIHDRQVNLALSKMATTRFTVDAKDNLAPYLVDGEGLIKVYQGRDLRLHGPINSVEHIDERGKHSLAVTASDPLVRIAHPEARRRSNRQAVDVTATDTDRGEIWKIALDLANADFDYYGNTGIRIGTQPYLSESTTDYTFTPYKPTIDILTELSQSLDGFDWRILPVEYDGGANDNYQTHVIGDWYAAPIIGEERPEAVFEFGTGKKNVETVRQQIHSIPANWIEHIADTGFNAPGAEPVVRQDWESIMARGGYEDVLQGGPTNLLLRQTLAEEHVRVRSRPRRVLSFKPHIEDPSQPWRVPRFGEDPSDPERPYYDLGDIVRVRAKDETGLWLDGAVRVYGVRVTPDEKGTEQLELTLVEDSSATEAA